MDIIIVGVMFAFSIFLVALSEIYENAILGMVGGLTLLITGASFLAEGVVIGYSLYNSLFTQSFGFIMVAASLYILFRNLFANR